VCAVCGRSAWTIANCKFAKILWINKGAVDEAEWYLKSWNSAGN